MKSNLKRHTSGLLALGVLLLAGCSSSTDPGPGVTPEAQTQALEYSQQILLADQALASQQLVEDITNGVTLGLADEAAGSDMTIGGEIPQGALRSAGYDMPTRIVSARRDGSRSARLAYRLSQAKSAGPGDLLYEETVQNQDGSESHIQVFEDSPASVVRVLSDTTWPNGNFLFESVVGDIYIDRGDDLESEADDILLSVNNRMNFVGGASLSQGVDARDIGGFADQQRLEVTSDFQARPGHPRLVSQQATLLLDVYLLDDESDDRFVRFDRTTNFRGTAHAGGSPRVVEALVPSSPVAEGEEPCGGTASREIYFANNSRLTSLDESAEFNCEGGGTLARSTAWADGSNSSTSISDDGNGNISLAHQDRDGVTTNGSWNETSGDFTFSTVFVDGNDPVRRDLSGNSQSDGTSFSLVEEILFADEFIERNTLQGTDTVEGKTLAGSHVGRDESVEFSLATNADETIYEGSMSNNREQSFDYRVELLVDFSRIVDFTAIDGANSVIGHLLIDADGCGSGTLDIVEDGNTATVQVEFCDEELSGGGQVFAL